MKRLGDLINPFAVADGPPPERLGAFFRWAISGTWPVLALAAILSALAGTLEVITALILGRVIDAAVATGPTVFSENVLLFAGFLVFFLVLRPIAFGLSSTANSVVVAPNINPLVLSRLHRWTLGQSVSFFDDDFAGRIAQKQMQTARALTDVVVEVVNVIFFTLASLVGSVLLLTTIDWRIALALAAWLSLYFLLIRMFLPRVRESSASRAGARAMVSGQVVDTITNIKTVKLFAHSKFEDQAALDSMSVFRDRSHEFGVISAWFRFLLMILAGGLPVVVITGVLLLWRQGLASPGDIAAAGAVALRIAQMSGWVSFTLMTIYSNIGEVEDGMRTLAGSVRLPDPERPEALTEAGAIRFENVSFAYGRRVGGVDGISLTVEPGEKVGIVGASGAGKSTLVSLLLRFYDPEGGRITVGGQDLRALEEESLRRKIGMVTQETAMFNRSARDNILYGRPDASEDEMVEAARRAEAHDFILDLADHNGRTGYDAHLGERGVKLSGGQRQRIALARAILKDAPVLVLDEATSALDSEVEASIQAALERVMAGKTVLAIAHRLSTLASMDRLIVLDQGRIVEEGSHEELLRKDGLYAQFWARQSGGFINTVEAAE